MEEGAGPAEAEVVAGAVGLGGKPQLKHHQLNATEVPSTPICRQETGPDVECTSGSERELTFVPSPPLAHGRMSSPRGLTSETGASSARSTKLIQIYSSTLFTMTKVKIQTFKIGEKVRSDHFQDKYFSDDHLYFVYI